MIGSFPQVLVNYLMDLGKSLNCLTKYAHKENWENMIHCNYLQGCEYAAL